MKTLKNIFVTASLLLNLISFVSFWILFKIGDYRHQVEAYKSKEVLQYIKDNKLNLENVVDSISYAGQLGRLDTVTLLLSIFGVLFGFAAIFGFLHIKESSEAIARDVARETVENHLRREDLNEEKKEIMSASKRKSRGKKAPKNWAEVNKQ